MIPDAKDLDGRECALTTARALLGTGSVAYRIDAPYHLPSGLAVPLHVDCRKLLSFPKERSAVVDCAARLIPEGLGTDFDAIAAAEGAGIPLAALIADRLHLPLLFVRKRDPQDPEHVKHRVEGAFKKGGNVLLVEQIAVDASRKARFVEALRDAGLRVRHVFVMFNYGIFGETLNHIRRLDIDLFDLTTWWEILEVIQREGALESEAIKEIEAFAANPIKWSQAHGGTDGHPSEHEGGHRQRRSSRA